MELIILNEAYEKVAVITEADSIVWNTQFSGIGYCEIYTLLDLELLSYLKQGYYIKRYDDEMVCQIVKRTIETDVEKGDYLVVYAVDMKTILNRRVVWFDVNYEGHVHTFIKRIIDENIIYPSMSHNERKIDNFIFDTSNFATLEALNNKISIATNKENILNLITTICEDYGYGFKITLNDNNQFVFKLLPRVDKSQITSNEYVEFSPEYANIISSHYEESDEGFKNCSIVAGEKVDGEEQIFITYGTATGLERREIYNDSGVSKTYKDENGIERTYTDAEYKAVLKDVAKLKLAENQKSESFNGEVDTIDTYIYKTDYNLGDIVRVKNEYGIEAPATIIGVIESEDNDNGYAVEPQFQY